MFSMHILTLREQGHLLVIFKLHADVINDRILVSQDTPLQKHGLPVECVISRSW